MIKEVTMYEMSTGGVFKTHKLALKAEIRIAQFNLLVQYFEKHKLSYDSKNLTAFITDWAEINQKMATVEEVVIEENLTHCIEDVKCFCDEFNELRKWS